MNGCFFKKKKDATKKKIFEAQNCSTVFWQMSHFTDTLFMRNMKLVKNTSNINDNILTSFFLEKKPHKSARLPV